ncbi:ATP-binding cassette domain-containing protein [Haloarchaeobius sp. TZWWS8]|uniref:ABC transporter ATP-binding protein n=1 Tax=Haloarchaeobius sp. TZWWS8 TaxID=3446121 RepID=UPI003EBC89AA
MTDAIVADGIEKTYGDTTALSGVSLSVAEGEVFALIGPNGAGKTTLVRSLTGTVAPDSGAARLLGSSTADVSKDRLGVLPQKFSPPERLSAREVVAYYAGLYDEARDVDEILSEVGVSEKAETWYENCSGGQQRRICLGATLVNDPDVLFLDEPTTGIDPAGRRTIWERIEGLASGGTTVFLTTHDMAEAERLADRVGLLAEGELVAVGTPHELVERYVGEDRLTVTVLDRPGRAAEAVDFEATVSGDEVVFSDVSPQDIGHVVDALDELGVEYTSVAWAEPSLEDVYLELTGERFEVESANRAVAAGEVER